MRFWRPLLAKITDYGKSIVRSEPFSDASRQQSGKDRTTSRRPVGYTVLSTVTLQYCLKLDELYLFYICSSELLWQFWVFYCSIQIFGLFALVLWKTIDNMDNLIRIALNLKIAFGFSSVTQSCPTLCNPMDCSMPGFPVHHQLQELAQTRVHQVGDAIQPTHPLSSPSLPVFLAHHQGLCKWVSSLHHVVKVLEFQLQHQSFQWIFRTDFF